MTSSAVEERFAPTALDPTYGTINSAIDAKGILDPFDARIFDLPGDRDHIEAAGPTRLGRVRLQIKRGGGNQSALFVRIHRSERAAKTSRPPIPHFDEHHDLLVLHDQIQLAMPTSHVARQHDQAGGLQMALGGDFETIAGSTLAAH